MPEEKQTDEIEKVLSDLKSIEFVFTGEFVLPTAFLLLLRL
jgi:hypothetical protein